MSSHTMSALVLWGLVATTAMTSILQAGQGLGLSRMSLTFLIGSAFSGERGRATVLGFVLYLLGGWAFAFVYFAFFKILGTAGIVVGAGLGLVHGVFLLACLMPLLPYLHPRMSSEHHGVTAIRLLEPPGFCAVNYGRRTAAMLLLGQAVYGGVLGWAVHAQNMMP